MKIDETFLPYNRLANELFGTHRICANPIFNVNADIYSGVMGLRFGLKLHLHPYFVYTSNNDSA